MDHHVDQLPTGYEVCHLLLFIDDVTMLHPSCSDTSFPGKEYQFFGDSQIGIVVRWDKGGMRMIEYFCLKK
jgi:hypothetical protein